MHWRFYGNKIGGKDKFGRTYEEALEEHAFWCFRTVWENKPDDQEKIDYLINNCITFTTMPKEFRPYLAGNAVWNSYGEIKINLNNIRRYYTDEENNWIDSWLKRN
ncbi:MAG: hypothetical protein KAI43_14095 [Candidatus Aureabacteria bacterium]|nr:hypothetical protein [Candidatus Auribacterota bacterium]